MHTRETRVVKRESMCAKKNCGTPDWLGVPSAAAVADLGPPKPNIYTSKLF